MLDGLRELPPVLGTNVLHSVKGKNDLFYSAVGTQHSFDVFKTLGQGSRRGWLFEQYALRMGALVRAVALGFPGLFSRVRFASLSDPVPAAMDSSRRSAPCPMSSLIPVVLASRVTCFEAAVSGTWWCLWWSSSIYSSKLSIRDSLPEAPSKLQDWHFTKRQMDSPLVQHEGPSVSRAYV